MKVRQEKSNDAGRVMGSAMQLPNGKWRPQCAVVVFKGRPGDTEDATILPVGLTDMESEEAAARAALEYGWDWFEKNVPTIL